MITQILKAIKRWTQNVPAVLFLALIFVGPSDAQVVQDSLSRSYYDGGQTSQVTTQGRYQPIAQTHTPAQPVGSGIYQSAVNDESPSAEACQCPECQAKKAEEEEAAKKAEAAKQARIRSQLTRDWGGRRSRLEERGIGVKSSLTQFYQGVASGGEEQIFRYGAKFDLYFDLNTEKLGWWKGGNILIHASEWQFGQNSIADATFLAPVNTNLLLPQPTEPAFAITHFLLQQKLNDKGLLLMLGRYNLIDLWEGFFPGYGHGLDGFMNASNLVPLNLVIGGLPPVSNVAGLLKAGEKGLESGFLVVETTNNPGNIGLQFENGVTLVGFGRKYTNFGGLPGSHLVAATWATGDFTNLDTNDWVQPPGGLPIPATQSGQWSAAYVGEQRLFQDPCNEKSYIKLFGYVGFGDTNTNLLDVTAAITLEKFGTRRRPGDRMGIGVFGNGLTDDFQNLLANIGEAGNVYGGEVYYNAAITPWFHLTFDLQAINPSFRSLDTALVPAIRGRIDF